MANQMRAVRVFSNCWAVIVKAPSSRAPLMKIILTSLTSTG